MISGGCEKVTDHTKDYSDRDGDRVYDHVIEEVITDGKLVRYETDNLYEFRKTLTTPENRQAVSYYDEDTQKRHLIAVKL